MANTEEDVGECDPEQGELLYPKAKITGEPRLVAFPKVKDFCSAKVMRPWGNT